mgnify:CR=1 FL=1
MISFVIVSYNEERNILFTFKEILKTIKKFNFKKYEIIFINDCSTDSTKDIILDIKKKNKNIKIINNKKNLGFGGSVKKGLNYAKYKYIFWVPGDNAHKSSQINKIIKMGVSENMDITSTYYTNKSQRSNFRKFFTSSYTPFLNFIFNIKIPYYNGIFLIKKNIIKKIEIYTNSHSWQVELWVKAKFLKNFKYSFVETIVKDPKEGATAFKFKNSIKVVINIFRLIIINIYLNFFYYFKD